MSLPKPPKELIDYLAKGQTVYFDHHLRRCGICYVDFTFGESDEDGPYAIDDEDDSHGFAFADEEEDGEIACSSFAGSMARFTP
jgi:hypothetical protein